MISKPASPVMMVMLLIMTVVNVSNAMFKIVNNAFQDTQTGVEHARQATKGINVK